MTNEECRFRSEVGESWAAVWAIARHIHALGGCSIAVPPLQLRPSFDEREGYGDDADLLIKTANGDWKRAEVKRRKLSFTSAEDYPYATLFVDRSTKADKASPDTYFILNEGMTHAARIDASTRPMWFVTTKYDRVKRHELTIYECQKALARFFKISADG